MSRIGSFKSRVVSRELMVGTFLKTPHYVMIEVFAQSGFDFLCLDAEHAPFDPVSYTHLTLPTIYSV